MNKKLYRVIAKRNTYIKVVVSEIASRTSGQSRKNLKVRHVFLAFLLLTTTHAALAQVVSAPNTTVYNPTILKAPDGAPLINIRTPNSSGLSINAYSQFSTDNLGAIFNNTRGSNPWLSQGSAKLIVNQVVSTTPSSIRGPLRIQGDMADLIIANPNGITIDGATFSNTRAITFSTGDTLTYNIDQSYYGQGVKTGLIQIGRAGLSTQSTTPIRLLGRAVKLDGPINAGQVEIIAGSNEVKTGNMDFNYVDGCGCVYSYGIYATSFSAINGEKITLIASDKDKPIWLDGNINATRNIQITADGQIAITKNLTAPVASISSMSSDVEFGGTGTIDNVLVINAKNDINLYGKVGTYTPDSALSLIANAGRDIIATGFGGSFSGMDKLENVYMSAGRNVTSPTGGFFSADGAVIVKAGNDINLTTGAYTSEQDSTEFIAEGKIRLNDVHASGSKSVTLAASGTAGSLPGIQLIGSTLSSSSGNIDVAATHSISITGVGAAGKLKANVSSSITGHNISLYSDNDVVIERTGLTQQKFQAQQDASITGKNVSMQEGVYKALRDFNINTIGGDVKLNGFVTEKTTSSTSSPLELSATGSFEIMSTGKVIAEGIKMSAGDTLFVGAQGDVQINSTGMTKPISIASSPVESTQNLHSTLNAGKDLTVLSTQGTTELWGTKAISTTGQTAVLGKNVRIGEYETFKVTNSNLLDAQGVVVGTQKVRTAEFSNALVQGASVKVHALEGLGFARDTTLKATAGDLLVICERNCSSLADWSEDERPVSYLTLTDRTSSANGSITHTESEIREKRREFSASGSTHFYGVQRLRNASVTAGKDIGLYAAFIAIDGRSTLLADNGKVRLHSTGRASVLGKYSYELAETPKAAAEVIRARDIEIAAASATIRGASLTGKQTLSINTSGGGIDITPFVVGDYTQGWDYGGFAHHPVLTGGNISMNSAGNINFSAVQMSGANIDVRAAGSLQTDGRNKWRSFTENGQAAYEGLVEKATIRATGNLSLVATQGNLSANAFDWSGVNVNVTAGGNMLLDSRSSYSLRTGTTVTVDRNWFSTTTYTTYNHNESTKVVPSSVSGTNIALLAGDSLTTSATRFGSTQNLNITAGLGINYFALANQTNLSSSTTKNKSLLGLSTYSNGSVTTNSLSTVGVPTQLQSQANITSTSGANQVYQGTQVTYGGTFTAKAGVGPKAKQDAAIYLTGIVNTTQTAYAQQSSYEVWQKSQGAGSYEQTLQITQFNGPTQPQFQAPGGLVVQVPAGQLTTQITNLSAVTGQGYVSTLTQRQDVNWQKISLAYDTWQYKQAGLTPEGAALLSLAVAVATGGSGASLLSTTGALSSAVANSAFTSLASTASLSLINNQGNVLKTLDELGKTPTIKALLSAVLTAGVMEGLALHPTLGPLKTSTAFSDKLVFNLIQKTGVALTNTAIYGNDLRTAIDSALLLAVVDSAQAQAANQVKGLSEQYVLHKVAHALSGCAAGVALSQSCKSGAIGAAVAEIVAELMPPANGIAYSDAEKKQVLDRVKLVSGGVAAFMGGDINEATRSAEVAVENNAFFVPALVVALKAVDIAVTTYELAQDLADLRDGKVTLTELATRRGLDYVTGVIFGVVGEYGLKITSKAGKVVVDHLSDVASPHALRQAKHTEVLELFDVSKPRNGLQLNDSMSTLVAKDISSADRQGVRVFDASAFYPMTDAGNAALRKDVFDYGKKLSGGVEFVEQKAGIWVAKLSDGTAVTLRENSSSLLADGTKPRWTIDYKSADIPSVNPLSSKVEMKFK